MTTSAWEWKPIETAPRTGLLKKILLCNSNKGWIAAAPWPLRAAGRDEFTAANGNFYPPTHWCELPPLPQEKKATAE